MATLAGAALVAGACGGEPGKAESDAQPVGAELGGSVAQLAQCRDWTDATGDAKLATIDAIRAQVNRGDAGIEAPPLTDDEALELFDNACAESFAAGFRLYGLYARAAGFAPLTGEP